MTNSPLHSGEYGHRICWQAPIDPELYAKLLDCLNMDPDCSDRSKVELWLAHAAKHIEERAATTALLQVREFTFKRFPTGCCPVELDCAPVWGADEWADIVARSQDADCDPWLVKLSADLSGKFRFSMPPVEIEFRNQCGAVVAVDQDLFELETSTCPAKLCPVTYCGWPQNCRCGCSGCVNVRVRYICGYADLCQMTMLKPNLLGTLLLTAQSLFMGQAHDKSVEMAIDQLKWRP